MLLHSRNSRLRRPSTILILSYNPIAFKPLIILNYRRTRLEVKSKPIKLGIRSRSNNIGKIIIKSSAI